MRTLIAQTKESHGLDTWRNAQHMPAQERAAPWSTIENARARVDEEEGRGVALGEPLVLPVKTGRRRPIATVEVNM